MNFNFLRVFFWIFHFLPSKWRPSCLDSVNSENLGPVTRGTVALASAVSKLKMAYMACYFEAKNKENSIFTKKIIFL